MVAAVIILSVSAAIWVTTMSATAAAPKVDWRFNVEAQQTPPDTVVAGNLVLAYADASVTALDASNGTMVWRIPQVAGPVRVTADAVVFASADAVHVHDLNTGAERFTRTAKLTGNPPAFAVTADTLFTSERDGGDREVVATSLTTKAKLWHREYGDEVSVAAPVLPDPVRPGIDRSHPAEGIEVAASSPVVYVNTGLREKNNEKTLTLDARNGATKGRPETTLDLDTYALIATGERVTALTSRDGCTSNVSVYDPGTEATTKIVFGADCDAGASAVLVTPGALLGQDAEGRPQVVDPATGAARWTAPEPGIARAFKEPVFAYSPQGREKPLKLVDVTGGEQPWQAEDTEPPSGESTLAGELLISSTGSFPTKESPDESYAETAYNLGIDKLMWHQPGARLVAYTDTHLILALCGTSLDDLGPATLAAVPYA